MSMKTRRWMLASVTALAVGSMAVMPVSAQRGGRRGAPPVPEGPPTAMKLEVGEGSKAVYRVQEKLIGSLFENDAVGETANVTGVIVIQADGTIDAAQSKIVVDLRTLQSDQNMRDGYIRGERGLNTEKFPTAEFVPRRAEGLPWPFPSANPAQAGFHLIGDMTVYGKTEEVSWQTVATFSPQEVAGRATTSFTFDKFGIPKPSLPMRLANVDDNIRLELQLRLRRSPL